MRRAEVGNEKDGGKSAAGTELLMMLDVFMLCVWLTLLFNTSVLFFVCLFVVV